MPTHGPAGPVIAGERVRPDANLGSQAPDDRRCKVGLFVWETAVLAPKRKLRRKAELAGVGEADQMRQIARQKRPLFVKLTCRPLLPHCRTPSTPNERSLQAGNQRRNVRWPKCTASWSLGLDAGRGEGHGEGVSHCHGASAKRRRLRNFQAAAATAVRHVSIATARSSRCVWAEVRWRWTLKML
jgi:hypothetical protein